MKTDKILQLDSLKEFEVKTNDDTEDFYIEGIASCATIDRDWEILPSSAIDTKNFERNPIILYQHDRTQPIGKAVEINKTEEGLKLKVYISKAASKVRQLIKEGILKAFSVGFRIKDYDFTEDGILVYKDIELYETSLVSVPCNPDALFEYVKEFNNELKIKDTNNPKPNKKENNEMDDKLKEMQEELARIKAEKEALAKEKREKEAAEKEAKEAKEKQELKDNIKTLTEGITAITESIKEVEAKIEEVKKEYDEKLEELTKKAPKIESVDPFTSIKADEIMDAYKDVLIHTMIFKGEKACTDPEVMKAGAAFSALPERMKAVTLDTQFTTRVHDEILRDIKNEASIYQLFREIPSTVTTDTIPFSAEMTASWGSASDNTFNPSKVNIEYHSIFSRLDYNYVVDEESIISWLPFIRQSIIEAISSGIDAQILDDAASPSNTFRGLASYAIGAGYEVEMADEADITVGDVDKLRATLGKYGVNPKNLVLVLNSDKYLQIVDDDLVSTVDKFGPSATILNGELAKVRGISILVNDNAVGSSNLSEYATTMLWKPGFAVKLKSFMVEFDRNVNSQIQNLVASARSGFGPLYPLTTNQLTNKIVVVGKNPAT